MFYVGFVSGVACSSGSSVPSLGGSNPAAPGGTLASGQTHGLVLTPVIGEGSGIVNVTANARTGGFVANTEDIVHVKGVTPNMLLDACESPLMPDFPAGSRGMAPVNVRPLGNLDRLLCIREGRRQRCRHRRGGPERSISSSARLLHL